MVATAKAPTQSRGMRRPLLPYAPTRQSGGGVEDKTQGLWPWYFIPFYEPDVSPECKAWVEGTYTPVDADEIAMLQSELAEANTIRGDATTAIIQAPGGAAAVRQDYQAKGFRLISPVAGDADNSLNIWPPQVESGHTVGRTLTDPYVGVKEIIESLNMRHKWQLAQLDAKIAMTEERMRDETGESKRFERTRTAAMKRRRNMVANGMPTVAELRHRFGQFELQRLQSQQDAKMKEAIATQGRIDNASAEVARLASEVNASSSWPPAGSEPSEEN